MAGGSEFGVERSIAQTVIAEQLCVLCTPMRAKTNHDQGQRISLFHQASPYLWDNALQY